MATDFLIRQSTQRREVDRFNRSFPIGTPVRYWTGLREGPGIASQTTTAAELLGGHTAVVWVQGHAPCVALSHVQPIEVER